MPPPSKPELLEKLLVELRWHIRGWLDKVARDLSNEATERELAALQGDPVYKSFGLATREYVLIRLMGRLSISIGRRLGEIYDKLPRIAAQARFGLDAESVAPVIAERLALDVAVPLSKLSPEDQSHVRDVTARHLPGCSLGDGPAIEIRYNFNPNDSARLRKDCEMAALLRERSLLPIYLVFSTISPRDEAIARLKRAGWTFLVGPEASRFMAELIGLDIAEALLEEKAQVEIKREMEALMKQVFRSAAFQSVSDLHTSD